MSPRAVGRGRPAEIRSVALSALAHAGDAVAESADRLVTALVPACLAACEVRLDDGIGGERATATRGDLSTVPSLDRMRRKSLDGRTTVTWRSDGEPAAGCVVACILDEDHAIGTLTCLLVGAALDDAVVDAVEDVGALLDLAVGQALLQTRARVAARRSQRIASQLHQLLAASMIVAGLEREDAVLDAVATRARSVFDGEEVVVTLDAGPAAPLRAISRRDTSRRAGDTAAPPSPGSGAPPTRSGEWLVAPLLVRRGESRGAIAIRHREGSVFSDDDVEVASLLAQLASSALDATELHRTIARSEERLRVLVDTAPVGIVETGPDGMVRWWNRAARDLFSWPDTTEAGKPGPSLPEVVRTALEEPWAAVLAGGEAGARDLPVTELAGRRRVLAASAALVPPTVGREAGVLTVVEDVTDQRQLMEELRHAQRMEVIGQLSSSVAHDFNNLLTLIAGYAELLVLEVSGEPRTTQLARDIQATTTRASTLTGKLLTMGRTKLPEPVVFSPVASVQDLSEVLDRIIGKDVALHLELDEATRLIRADPDQFEQMVMNLATNARDAMPEGGSLRIAIRPVSLSESEAREAGLAPGEYVRITLADSGVGMDDETARRCFEPLFTTKGPSKGTGLGLPAARRVVVEGGGSITVRSVVDTGTTFEILFPSVDEGPVVVEEPEPAPRAGAGVTVLLAEDDEGIRALIARILRHNGYVVHEAASAEAALEAAGELPGPIELLISDVVLGGMTGGELASLLQADRPDLLVVLVSGNVDEAVLGSVAEGSGSFLPKPFKPSELIGVIDELRGRRESTG